MAFLIFEKERSDKFSSTLHYWVSMFSKIDCVICKDKVFPKWKGHPCTAQRKHSPIDTIDDGRFPENIGGMMHRPSVCSVHFAGCFTSGNSEPTHKINYRIQSFSEIADFCRPVVHLEIDIYMVIGTPGSPIIFIPDSL